MESKLKEGLANCKTDKQVLALLKKLKLTIHEDKTAEYGYLNLWLDEQTRVYGRGKSKGYKLQLWNKTTEKIIGKREVPTCYGYTTIMDNVQIIKHEYDGILSR